MSRKNMRLRAAPIALAILVIGATPVGSITTRKGPVVAPFGSGDAAIARTLRLPAATGVNDRNGNKVFDSLEARFARHPGSTQEVIVTLVYGSDVGASLEEARGVAGPFRPTHVFPHLGGFVAHLRLEQALRIGTLGSVRQIEWGAEPGRPLLDTATANGGVRAIQTALDIDGDGAADPITGKGVTIAVLDTGFDDEHVDLEGSFLTFIDENAGGVVGDPYDSDGHGTHVASIAAGRGVGDPALRGVAPGADLVGFRIDEGCPPTYFYGLEDIQGACGDRANVLNAVDWMIANREQYRIEVMTMSYGWSPSLDGTDVLDLAMDRLWEAGIIPFVAAGNSGPERGSVGVPAGARGAVAVGMMSDAQVIGPNPIAPHLSPGSSRGPTSDGRIKPDIAAYGVSVRAAEAGTRNGYVEFSGTSMATPYAAGVAALVLEANPSLEPSDVRRILFETAEDWGPPGADIDYGHGLIRPLDAVRRALEGGTAVDPVLPEHGGIQLEVSGPSATAVQAAIDVVDGSGPVAVTVIVRGRSTPPVPDHIFLDPTDRRAISIHLLAPGESAGPLASYETNRQVVFRVPRPVEGRYILRAHNLGRADVLDVDVTGADISITPL